MMEETLARFNWIDFTLIGLVVLGFVMGSRKGLAVMINRTISLGGTMLVAFHFYSFLSQKISANSFLPMKTTEVLIFFLLSIVTWLGINVLLNLLSKVMEVKFSESVSRSGGLLLGGIWFFAFGGFLLYALLIFQLPFFQAEWASHSFLAPYAIQFPVALYHIMFGASPPQPAA